MLGFLLAFLPAQVAPPTDTAPSDTVHYGGQLVRFFARTEEVVLLDSAWVRYHEMTVYSDSIHYDIERHRLSAYGDVLFNSGEQNISGVLLQYDIDTRKGMMRTARTEVEEGFFRAQEIWLVEEKVLNARRGCYTTCELDPPHFDFYGPRVKLLMDDIAIVQPVVLRIRGIPVLAAPFWIVPVASERKSGLMPFKVGYSEDQGYYAKNLAYYWVLNGYADATFYCDVMTRKGVQPRAEAVYRVLPLAEGSLQGSYIEEWDTRRRRYSFNATHSSDFLFGTDLQAQADFQSDASYAPEYAEEQLDWLKQDIFSYAELSRKFLQVGRFSARVEQKKEFARFRSYSYLPRARFSFGARPLPLEWTATPSISFEHLSWTLGDSTGIDTARTRDLEARLGVGLSSPDYSLGPSGDLRVSHALSLAETRGYWNDSLDLHSRGVSNNLTIGLSQRPFGALNTYQDVTVQHSEDLADTLLPETRYLASLSSSFAMYRVLGIEAAGLHGLLHTVRPTFTLDYEPEVSPGVPFGRPSPLTPSAAQLRFTVLNGFEAKVGSLKTKASLGRLDLNTSYDLRQKRLAPMRISVGLAPLRSVSNLDLQLDGDAGFDFDSLRFRDDYAVRTSLSWDNIFGRTALADPGTDTTRHPPQRDWRVELNLGHTYGKLANMVTGMMTLYVPGWRFALQSIGYNFTSKQLTDYKLTVWKDLHCWEAILDFTRLGSQWKYDFEVRIKRLPDVKFGKSTFRTFLPD